MRQGKGDLVGARIAELAPPAIQPITIGRYQIAARLASGGMSELFKGVFVGEYGFKKPIVVKRLLPHLAADKTCVEMFLDEARIAARLNHRNIIEVLELGNDGETQFMAMQYVDGIDLLGLLDTCARSQISIPPELAALIAREILDALDYAHGAKDPAGRALEIVHRDLSPGNVMVSWNGDIKLVDFGRAHGTERRHKTKRQSLKGKCGYMSPEQVSAGLVDARTDLFQVGILLAELVMGRPLFAAERELDVLLMVREGDLRTLDQHAFAFPRELLAITERALQRAASDRWQTAAEFRDVLDEWIENTARVSRRELAALLGTLATAPPRPRPIPATALGSGAMPPMNDDDDDEPTTISGPPTPTAANDSATSRMDASAVLAYLLAEQARMYPTEAPHATEPPRAAEPMITHVTRHATAGHAIERATTGSDIFATFTFENRIEQTLRLAQGTARNDEPVLQAAAEAHRVEASEAPAAPVTQPKGSILMKLAVASLVTSLGGLAYFFLT